MKTPGRVYLSLLVSILTFYQVLGQSDTTIILQQVVVFDSGENPAHVLLKKVRENLKGQEEDSFPTLKVYSRSYNTRTNRVDFESLSSYDLGKTPRYQEVLSWRDFQLNRADFGNSVKVSAQADFSFDPHHDFNEGAPQGPFKAYPLMDLSKVYWSPLYTMNLDLWAKAKPVGLLSWGTFTNYAWSISKTYAFDGAEYAELAFHPKTANGGWEGILVVNSTSNLPVSISAQLSEDIRYQELVVKQEFSRSVPTYLLNGTLEIGLKNRTEFKVVDLMEVESKAPPRLLVASIPEQSVQDENYWEQYRPASLEIDRWTAKQDSIIQYLNSDAYLDSADAEYNEFHWYEPLVTGIGFRKRSKGYQFYLSPLISQWNFVGIGGVRWMPTGLYSQRLNNDQSYSLAGNVNYGFTNKDLKGSFRGSYTYAPMHNGSFSLGFGDEYNQITQSVDLTGLFARSNYINKQFIEGYHRYEWFNGFYTRVGFEYSRRRSIDSLQLSQWSTDLFGALNQPEPFPTYTVGQISAEFLYRPFQRYYLKGKRKINLASRWPEFRLELKQGIPNLLNSDVSYTKYEFDVSHWLRWTGPGLTFYRVASGGFLNDPSTVRFIEYKWFRGGDRYLFTHPVYTLQSLDQTFASPSVYYQAHAIHHFDGLILNRVPLIRALHLGIAVGGAALIVPEQDISHVETYIGLEKKMKLWKQPVRWGLYYNVLPTELNQGYVLKFGMDFQDTFNDKWNW